MSVLSWSLVGSTGLAMMGLTLMEVNFLSKKRESLKLGVGMLLLGGILASVLAVVDGGHPPAGVHAVGSKQQPPSH